MFEWILFTCAIAPNQTVTCRAFIAPSEEVCMMKRDELLALKSPVAATCFPDEKTEDTSDTT